MMKERRRRLVERIREDGFSCSPSEHSAISVLELKYILRELIGELNEVQSVYYNSSELRAEIRDEIGMDGGRSRINSHEFREILDRAGI